MVPGLLVCVREVVRLILWSKSWVKNNDEEFINKNVAKCTVTWHIYTNWIRIWLYVRIVQGWQKSWRSIQDMDGWLSKCHRLQVFFWIFYAPREFPNASMSIHFEIFQTMKNNGITEKQYVLLRRMTFSSLDIF